MPNGKRRKMDGDVLEGFALHEKRVHPPPGTGTRPCALDAGRLQLLIRALRPLNPADVLSPALSRYFRPLDLVWELF